FPAPAQRRGPISRVASRPEQWHRSESFPNVVAAYSSDCLANRRGKVIGKTADSASRPTIEILPVGRARFNCVPSRGAKPNSQRNLLPELDRIEADCRRHGQQRCRAIWTSAARRSPVTRSRRFGGRMFLDRLHRKRQFVPKRGRGRFWKGPSPTA